MSGNKKLITAILTIVIGIILVTMKGSVISYVLTALGLGMIILGALDISKKSTRSGVIKIIIGAAAIVFGWAFVSIVLYVIAAVLIIYSAVNLYSAIKSGGSSSSATQTIVSYAKPTIGLIAGICLFFNQGGTVSWVFVLAGLICIAEGVLMLTDYKKN